MSLRLAPPRRRPSASSPRRSKTSRRRSPESSCGSRTWELVRTGTCAPQQAGGRKGIGRVSCGEIFAARLRRQDFCGKTFAARTDEACASGLAVQHRGGWGWGRAGEGRGREVVRCTNKQPQTTDECSMRHGTAAPFFPRRRTRPAAHRSARSNQAQARGTTETQPRQTNTNGDTTQKSKNSRATSKHRSNPYPPSGDPWVPPAGTVRDLGPSPDLGPLRPCDGPPPRVSSARSPPSWSPPPAACAAAPLASLLPPT